MADARQRLRDFAPGGALPAYCTGYRGFGELCELIAGLPESVDVFIDGTTSNGSPLIRLELRCDAVDPGKLALIAAGIHAMEWVGVEVALATFLRLVERAKAASLPRRVVYYPLLNPDGYRNAERDLRAGKRRFRRANARGVDLNRNWPTNWSAKVPFTRRLVAEGGHHGSHAGSEIEVSTVINYLTEQQRDGVALERAAALHSFGGVILVPTEVSAADQKVQYAHAERLRESMKKRFGIRTGNWPPGPSYGLERDYFASLGAASLLVECGPHGGIEVTKPGSWIHPWRWYNPVNLEFEIENVAPGLVDFLGGG